ncbi:DMT family transporter [Rhizobium sp. TH2]|uniref:DMT family transporter n=1 Tax=Rhizobium sp. TH2 TaxID=2775403 RepID=UPI0021577ACB|nr:DMT family transporter [Rhizobium sp. TH2]UVC10535.1 DMT family transporter [Rhizobium sp. TH2]
MMCTASLCFNLNDTFTKFLVVRYGISEIILLRCLIALPLLAVMAIVIGRARIRWSSRIFFHAVRGGLNLVAAYLYIHGLQYLSVAEATVILFSSPLIVTLASAYFFKEAVGWQKWAAAICSFTGVIIAIRPGTETFQPASLFILAAGFLYAANSLTARWIPEADNLWTVSFFGAAFAAVFVTPLAITNWVPVRAEDLMSFTAAALCSSLGIGLSSLAYRLALASDLAPYAYSGLIWSLGITWIVWGTIPTAWTLLGAAVIAASSLFHFLSSRPPFSSRP